MTPGEIPTPDQVKAVRESAGLTQRQAAELIWVSEGTWRQWESTSAVKARKMMPVAWWAFNKRIERRSKA
jgi:DNA-binding transcriptional regulator YiaG